MSDEIGKLISSILPNESRPTRNFINQKSDKIKLQTTDQKLIFKGSNYFKDNLRSTAGWMALTDRSSNSPSSKGDIQGNSSTSFDFSLPAVTFVKRTVEEPYFAGSSMMISRHQSCRKQEHTMLYSAGSMFENQNEQ